MEGDPELRTRLEARAAAEGGGALHDELACLDPEAARSIDPRNVRRVIRDPAYRDEMVNHNYELGKAFFSYSVLRRKLRTLITNITGLEDL
mgnify:CR=1 FL=1